MPNYKLVNLTGITINIDISAPPRADDVRYYTIINIINAR